MLKNYHSKLLLTESASDWLDSLVPADSNDFDRL